MIVPTAWASEIVAFVGPERLRKKLSVTSSSRSPFTSTITCCVVCPAANVSVPVSAVKSAGAIAEPLAVA